MNGLFAAADEVQRVCAEQGWSFCFIGGLAVQRWGEPRVTRDVDLTLLVPFGEEEDVLAPLLGAFESRVADAADLARRARVVLVRTAAGTPVDVALGALPFEERSVARASGWAVAPGLSLTTCGAEDLVVYKAFAGRDRDWADLRGVAARLREGLDIALVRSELEPLLEVKGAAGDLARVERLFAAEG